MTYTPTHFAVAGLFVWTMLGEKRRNEFAQHKKGHFLLLNIVTILPDFDFIFLNHRGASHSLVGPLLLLVVGLIMRSMLEKKEDARMFYGDMIILLAIFWQLHIILDLGLGPLAIFWPISNNYYDFSFAIKTTIESFGFIPFLISGLYMSVDRLSPREGRLHYVYNWSPEDRIEEFGSEAVKWIIPDIFLHILIFLVWIAVVGRNLIPKTSKFQLLIDKMSLNPVLSSIPVILSNRISILATFIIFLAFVVGPMQGPIEIENEKRIEADLILDPRKFAPGIWISSNIEKTASATAIVEIDYMGSGTLGLVRISQSEMQNFSKTLFEGWNQSRTPVSDGNATYSFESVSMSSDFPSNYSNLIEDTKNKTCYRTYSANEKTLGPITFTSGNDVILAYVHTWNLNSFDNGPWEITLIVKSFLDRTIEYELAGLAGLIGIFLLAIPIASNLRKAQQREKY